MALSCEALLQECHSALPSGESGNGVQSTQSAISAECADNHEITPQDADATQPFDLPPGIEAMRIAKKSKVSPVSNSFVGPSCACFSDPLTGQRCVQKYESIDFGRLSIIVDHREKLLKLTACLATRHTDILICQLPLSVLSVGGPE